jgi:hypothetical protein
LHVNLRNKFFLNPCKKKTYFLHIIPVFGDQIKFDKVKLIVSDQAPYAVKLEKLMLDSIPGVKHVICPCHLLHRLCEETRGRSNKLNFVCAEIKRLLVKNRHNQRLYGSETGLSLPKLLIVTRWGLLIEFVCYIADNYNEIFFC